MSGACCPKAPCNFISNFSLTWLNCLGKLLQFLNLNGLGILGRTTTWICMDSMRKEKSTKHLLPNGSLMVMNPMVESVKNNQLNKQKIDDVLIVNPVQPIWQCKPKWWWFTKGSESVKNHPKKHIQVTGKILYSSSSPNYWNLPGKNPLNSKTDWLGANIQDNQG